MRQGTLYAVRFDLDRLETIGRAVPALEGVSGSAAPGAAKVGFSSEGTVVYVPAAPLPVSPIHWMMRDGRTSVLRATRAAWGNPSFSPDGRKLAMDIFDGKQSDIWVYEWERDTLTQLTIDPGRDTAPNWTPDGRRIVFASDRANPGVHNLYWMNADGTGDVSRLTENPEREWIGSWHPTGKFLAFQADRAATGADLAILPMEGDPIRGWTPGTPTIFFRSPVNDLSPTFSPDGRWIAYFSAEAGNNPQVYVRPFLGSGGPWRISTESGRWPQWSTSTQELLFLGEDHVMVAPYSVVGESFRADKPRAWSPMTYRPMAGPQKYALHPDGQRLAIQGGSDESPQIGDKVVFVFNFFDYLNTIAPGDH